MSERINKYLSAHGVCSRREADRMIQEGRITIDGRIAVMGEMVEDNTIICVDGRKVDNTTPPQVVIAFNKPVGIVCTTTDKQGKNNIVEEVDLKDYVPSDMYVLTNESKLNGAACILYENVLYDFAQKLGADLYILPSSVHEVILLPKLSMFEKDELVNMVKEVNTEGVAADEVLSDHVYEYNRTERLITM